MYKLIYKSQFVAGFDVDQIVGNLAQLLQLKPKTIRLVFLSERPSVIKILESDAEVAQWRAAFLEAGVHLDVVSMAAPDADSIADQIELELELHSLDDDIDEEFEPPRQLLVKKIIAREDAEEAAIAAAKNNKPIVAINSGDNLTEQTLQQDELSTIEKPVIEKSAIEKPALDKPVREDPIDIEVTSPSTPSVVAEPEEITKEETLPIDEVQEESVATASAPSESIEELQTKPVVAEKKQPEEQQSEEQQSENLFVIETDAAQPDVKLVVEGKPELDDKIKLESELAVDIKPEPDVNAVPENNVKPEDKSETEIKVESDSKSAPDVNQKSDDKADAGIAEENKEQDVAPDDTHVEVDFHKSSFVWGMLVIVFAIALTAATILWLKRPLWIPVTASAQADKVVSAIASESLFVLAHVDVKRLQQLPDVLQKGSGLKNLPAPDVNFWRNLELAGIDISAQVEQAWVAAYRSNNQTQKLWVLTGKFNAEKIRAWLKKNYSLDEESAQQIVFSAVDENTCEKQPVMMAVVESDRILLGAPERVAAYRGRTDASAPAEKDLADWNRISTTQMLTVALFNPAQVADASTAIALGKLSIDPAPVKGIYLGVAPRLLPPTLEFNAVMVGTEQPFINSANDQVAQALANVKNTIVKDWPETLPLYERMKLSQTEQQLHATVLFDEKVQAQLQLWVSSLLARTFAMDNSGPVATVERIDEKPRRFSELTSAQLPEFASSKHLNNAFTAQTATGPFGVGISNIEATAQGVVITLDVSAFNLPNLGKEKEGAIQLRITDIVDHQDKSLLTATRCDATGVRQIAKVNMLYEGAFFEQGEPKTYIGIQGTKKILLPENITLSNIGAIKGELEYKLPTKVEHLIVKAPLAGKLLDTQGLQLRFLSAGGSRVYFQHSGNTDALLQVNALNAAGKVLAITTDMRGDNFFDAGKTTSIDVQGNVAAAEVFVASKVEKKVYPFSFGRIQPSEKTFAVEKPAPELLTTATLTLLKKDSPPTDVKYPYQTPQQTIVAGPALIAVNQLGTQAQQLSLMADIYLRNQHPLTRQLSAARFFITEVEDSAGNIHPVNFQAPIALEYEGGTWVDGKFQLDPMQPWLRGQLELRGQDLGVSDVIAFWGKLVFLAAAEPIAIQLPFQFGMQWNGAESSFKLARWEEGRLLFDIHGSFPELMAITALDDNGVAVSQAAELRSSLGVNQVELPIKQRPATIEFSIARNQQTAEFPFEIRVLP